MHRLPVSPSFRFSRSRQPPPWPQGDIGSEEGSLCKAGLAVPDLPYPRRPQCPSLGAVAFPAPADAARPIVFVAEHLRHADKAAEQRQMQKPGPVGAEFALAVGLDPAAAVERPGPEYPTVGDPPSM